MSHEMEVELFLITKQGSSLCDGILPIVVLLCHTQPTRVYCRYFPLHSYYHTFETTKYVAMVRVFMSERQNRFGQTFLEWIKVELVGAATSFVFLDTVPIIVTYSAMHTLDLGELCGWSAPTSWRGERGMGQGAGTG